MKLFEILKDRVVHRCPRRQNLGPGLAEVIGKRVHETVFVIDQQDADAALDRLSDMQQPAMIIGEVVPDSGEQGRVEVL